MTREEYINFANALMNNYTIDFDKLPEFCDMAISILSAPDSVDLISREDVKARYKERFMNSLVDEDRNIDFSEYAETPCKRFNEFIDSIPCAVPERKKEEWIPVSEGLPLLRTYKISDDVLITNGYEIDMGYLVERNGKIFWHYYGSDYEYGIKDEDNDAIAWMPLPKPYKAEKGGEAE